MSGKKSKVLSIPRLNLSKIKLLLRDVREAISGTERDFTEASPGHAIFILAVPMVLEMVMESVFAVVDIFFVSKLGAGAVATVGITESVMTIVYAIAMGLSVATTALVSRRIGEKKQKEAGVVAFQAILAGMIVSSIIAVPGVIFAKDFLLLMGATEEMAEEGYLFPAIMFGSNAVIMLLFIINAVFLFYALGMVLIQGFNGSGDTVTPTKMNFFIFWLFEIPLAYLLTIVLGWGLSGASIAIVIAESSLAVVAYLFFRKGKWKLREV